MKIYPGALHGLTQITTYKDEFSTDLLNLLKVLKRYRLSGTPADHSSAGCHGGERLTARHVGWFRT
jgi:hypothetical protein